MLFLGWMLLALLAWGAWALLVRWIHDNPRGDFVTGLVYRVGRGYTRWFHRLRVEGETNVPGTREPGPLIVVCNHTAGVDPVLVQSACPFFIRWMMGKDMRTPLLEDVWEWLDIIDVDRTGRDTSSARTAIRHAKGGGVVGIFPEGRIERPAGQLLPFRAGLGLIVASSGAAVLPVLIAGTPDTDSAWGSLVRRGHATLRVGAVMRFSDAKAEAITREIEGYFLKMLDEGGA